MLEKLILGSYEFKIKFQSVVGRGIFSENGITLYLPDRDSLKPAFEKGLSHMIKQINMTIEKKGLPRRLIDQKSIEEITQYVIKDYMNREAFNHNIQAGLEADKLFLM